jgi:hypothetical protein
VRQIRWPPNPIRSRLSRRRAMHARMRYVSLGKAARELLCGASTSLALVSCGGTSMVDTSAVGTTSQAVTGICGSTVFGIDVAHYQGSIDWASVPRPRRRAGRLERRGRVHDEPWASRPVDVGASARRRRPARRATPR